MWVRSRFPEAQAVSCDAWGAGWVLKNPAEGLYRRLLELAMFSWRRSLVHKAPVEFCIRDKVRPAAAAPAAIHLSPLKARGARAELP